MRLDRAQGSQITPEEVAEALRPVADHQERCVRNSMSVAWPPNPSTLKPAAALYAKAREIIKAR